MTTAKGNTKVTELNRAKHTLNGYWRSAKTSTKCLRKYSRETMPRAIGMFGNAYRTK
jgi:hypothetical protein